MLVVFPPIFVTDRKIIYGYNFVAPLRCKIKSINFFVSRGLYIDMLIKNAYALRQGLLNYKRLSMWQLETQPFVLPYI